MVPPCSKHILCGLSAQSQAAGRFLCSSSRTSLRATQFHGQAVEDKRFWIWTLWTPQGSFSQVIETVHEVSKENLRSQVWLACGLRQTMIQLVQNPLNWHLRTRLGLRSGEQSAGRTQKVTLELKSIGQSVGGWVGWCHSGGRSQAQADLALLGQPVDDLCLKICVVDARLPEGPGVAVLLPVVVPVALLVGAVAEHRHLDTDTRQRQRLISFKKRTTLSAQVLEQLKKCKKKTIIVCLRK